GRGSGGGREGGSLGRGSRLKHISAQPFQKLVALDGQSQCVWGAGSDEGLVQEVLAVAARHLFILDDLLERPIELLPQFEMLLPLVGKLRQYGDAGANVFAALHIVRRRRIHGMREGRGAAAKALVELSDRDTKAPRITAHFVE